jgi:GNAT superfamily N-acetyltransferase
MNPPQFGYRAAAEDDAGEMIEVHYAAVHAVGTEYYSTAVLLAWSPSPDEGRRQWLANLIAQDSTRCTIAVSEQNKIMGFCIALPAQAQLKALYVHPDFTQQGVGHGLLHNIELQCRSCGLEALELNASYNAERFYQRGGYRALGPVDQALANGSTMGSIHMVKHFSPHT